MGHCIGSHEYEACPSSEGYRLLKALEPPLVDILAIAIIIDSTTFAVRQIRRKYPLLARHVEPLTAQ